MGARPLRHTEWGKEAQWTITTTGGLHEFSSRYDSDREPAPQGQRKGSHAVLLSQDHLAAVNRPRRIIIEYDAFDPPAVFGMDFNDWLALRFDYIDEPGTQVDTVLWDFTVDEAGFPRMDHPGLSQWSDQGTDPIQGLVEASRKRGLETLLSHRFSEVEFDPGTGLSMKEKSALKKDHPDWVVKTWWWQGLWNAASEEVRAYKLDLLRGQVERYDLDGLQINFARHIPCLPVGHQWENREHVTEFIRSVRRMLLAFETARGRPLLLAVKVPEALEGCQVDGFDVATWAQEDLVDLFTVGTRTMHVDLEGYRRITRGKAIKLCPCFDDHHTTDGYMHHPIEFLRGVYSNWWHQGADAVETFNWATTKPEVCRRLGVPEPYPSLPSHQQAYHEVGSLETMRHKDKTFAAERRGGYPWAEGYFGRNDHAPLPAMLANDGRPVAVRLPVYEDLRREADAIKAIIIRVVLFGASEGDVIETKLNGDALMLSESDFAWKDPQILSPQPQPASGSICPLNPEQKLLRLDFTADPEQFVVGGNRIEVRVLDRVPYLPGEDIQVEKVEAHVFYKVQTPTL